MTLQKSVSLVVALLVLLVTPLSIGAAQRALTVDSLERAYKTRLSALDTDLASTTKAMDTLIVPLRPPYTEYSAKKTYIIQEEYRLKSEKTATISAYNLLQEALK